MNKKVSLIIAVILLVSIVGFVSYRAFTNSPSQKRAVVARKVEDYYKAEPRKVTQEDISKANNDIAAAPADSLCGKLGYKYQITSRDGSTLCTEGYH